MDRKSLYQTVEDRGDPDHIKRNGPFLCKRKDAWLGNGYYFWESFLQNAHWWGRYSYTEKGGNYVICKATYQYNEKLCFNIIDSPKHLEELSEAIELLKKHNLYINGKTTIARVVEFLHTTGSFPYEAIRANVCNTRRKDDLDSQNIIVSSKYTWATVDLIPPIQVCFFKKTSLELSEYQIIYPTEYMEGSLM